MDELKEKYDNCDNVNKSNCNTYNGISIGMIKNYYYLTKNK